VALSRYRVERLSGPYRRHAQPTAPGRSSPWSWQRATQPLVETAGGVRSPQAHDGDAADLARLLSPDVVLLVADAGLGAIGAVRLCADALAGPAGPCPPIPSGGADLVVVLNRFDPADDLHRRNADWLRRHDRLAVVVVPGEVDLLAQKVLGPPRHVSA
jgi:dethiobiotin synthetase